MTTRTRKNSNFSDKEAERFGFRWGQLDVQRSMEWRDGKQITVLTDHGSIDIYVSPKGHNIRVWKDGRELK